MRLPSLFSCTFCLCRPLRRARVLLGPLGLATLVAACGGSAAPAATDGNQASVGTGDSNVNTGGTDTTGSVVRKAGPAVAPGAAGLAVIPMEGCVAVEYYSSVLVGDDPIHLLLDSGSTITAVASKSCRNCPASEMYDGSTGTSLRTSLDSTYGDGSYWQGTLYSDSIDADGANAQVTPAVTTKFAVISQQQNFFFDTAASCQSTQAYTFGGIFGLGPDSLLSDGATSYLTGLAATKKMANDAYALQTCNTGGNLMLGGYATNTVSEQPFFVPMLTSGGALYYYSVALQGMAVGSTDTGLRASQLGAMVVDSGTNTFLLPSTPFNALMKILAKDTAFNANFDLEKMELGYCMAAAQTNDSDALDAALPKLKLVLAQSSRQQVTLEIDATRSYLVPYKDVDGDVVYCFAPYENQKGDELIFGNPMMRQHVVIFDRANRQIGFAQQVGCDTAPASLSWDEL